MRKSALSDNTCVIARALAEIGEAWTMLILRNAFHGMRRFEHFEKSLGIATNTLADRLKKLTEADILLRQRSPEDGRIFEYRLSEKGLDLYPVIVSLLHWGERWRGESKGPRLRLIEKASGKAISPMAVRSVDGRPLNPRDVKPVAGPAADPESLALLAHRGE